MPSAHMVLMLLMADAAQLQPPPRYPIICLSRQRPFLDTLKMLANHVPTPAEATKPLTAAEIGVFIANYSTVILKHLQPAKLYLLDLWGCTSACDASKRLRDTHAPVLSKARGGPHGFRRQVYKESNKDIVEEKFAREIRAGRIQLIQGKSLDTISQLPAIDIAYLDTLHDYTLTASELRLLAQKVAPGGFLCGHDYTHGAGSNYLDDDPFAEVSAPITFGVIEAVNEFLVYNPTWFMPIRTTVSELSRYSTFCLARWADFPHQLHEQARLWCKEEKTLEAHMRGEKIEGWNYELYAKFKD